VLGLVGESGSGKSTLARTIMQLVPTTAGNRGARGTEPHRRLGRGNQAAAPRPQMVFQDPFRLAHPRMTVLRRAGPNRCWLHGVVHRGPGAGARRGPDGAGRARATLHERSIPHEFSGGQRQRIAIARALGLEPRVIIGRRTGAALDVSIQAQILNLLAGLSADDSR